VSALFFEGRPTLFFFVRGMVGSRSPLRRTDSPALAGVRFGFAFRIGFIS
jgi:hypothetical protein